MSIVKLWLFLLVLVAVKPAISADVQGEVVLIAASGSNVEAMSHRDLRRLYLGLKSKDNKSVRSPVLNLHSEELYDEFLKNIMRMTAGSYKRKLVKAMFRQGKEEITEATTLRQLNDYLLENKGNVSFIALESVEQMKNVEVVQILW